MRRNNHSFMLNIFQATNDSSILSPNARRRSSGAETEERLAFVDARWVVGEIV